ncbi:MAG: hydroxymethylglutaryl-CoA lyase [Cytophagaceae bacterium]|nr:hydroxymethylglutaryl-CoA lyase [Cytophagaceae bacterium]
MKLVECPRDAMQGLAHFVPTEVKAVYLNHLLEVGFDTLDFGSFVSPKAIPQLRDTAQVLAQLDLSATKTRLLAIVANPRGATDACQFEEISYLGYPLSVSETFQQRNTNRSITEALGELAEIQNLCIRAGKTLVVYLSMGFGNPYGDAYSPEMVAGFAEKLAAMGVKIAAPSDTVGSATPAEIEDLFTTLIPAFPAIEFGAHLHSTPQAVEAKIAAAYSAGVRRIDGALRGYGGCPMAKDDLTGNLPTERIIDWLESQNIDLQLNKDAFAESMAYSSRVF